MKSVLYLFFIIIIPIQLQAQKTGNHVYSKKIENLCNEIKINNSDNFQIKYPKGSKNENKAKIANNIDSLRNSLNQELQSLDFHWRYMLKYRYEYFINCKGELVD